jgi:hypothetical protein
MQLGKKDQFVATVTARNGADYILGPSDVHGKTM